jgi:hypothetical protein
MMLDTNAILLEFLTSKMIQNMVTAVSDIIRELNNNPMVTNGDTDKMVAI